MYISPRIHPTVLRACFAAAVLLSPVAVHGGDDAPAKPAPINGFDDEGEFVFYLRGEPIVEGKFKWDPSGDFKNDYTLSMAGQSVDTAIHIACDKAGNWTGMSLETPLGPVEVERSGGTITIKNIEKDETTTIEVKPDTLLFENFSPVLMGLAVREYDREKGGKQTFPLFIVPAAIRDATLELKDTVERRVGNEDLRLTRYVYGVPGADVIIWCDDAGKVYVGEVPSQNGAYVRKGYESLRSPEVDDPKLSKPTHEITIDRNVMVPMRDGVKLATDIYRPADDGTYPVILIRTPYQKNISELDGKFYAKRGYVCAIQDCRGRFASEGEWHPFVQEPEDGYDAIEWLAVQPWSTGKVGMIGASYLGWVQWWAASENPPHLVTIIPNVSPPDPFYNIPYEYGVFFLTGSIWWAEVVDAEATADISGRAMNRIFDKEYHKLLRDLPVIDLDLKVYGKKNPHWRRWIEHNSVDKYWEQASFLDHLKDTKIPVFHQSGWFDGDGIGSKLNYGKMASHGHPNQKLTLGPWGHSSVATRRIGDRDFTAAAIIDLPREYLRWFDHFLKGVDNGITEEPLVSCFVMGSNVWLQGDSYPLPQSEPSKLYLHSGGKANTSKGDGTLSFDAPAADAAPDNYTYNPGDPTPCPHMYEAPDDDSEAAKITSLEEKKKMKEAYHEKVTSARGDILVYQTPPLETPVTFAGPISAKIYASTTAKDTDWFVRLMEVDEDGEIFLLAEGKLRARFRNSMREPELLTPGEVVAYDVDLWQTGITIPKGRRLRVEVASASFPLFSRNLNTGGHNEMESEYVAADQTIYHDAAHPSHVLLPIIPADKLPKAEE